MIASVAGDAGNFCKAEEKTQDLHSVLVLSEALAMALDKAF